MKFPTWVAVVGVAEALLGVWGLYAVVHVSIAGAARNGAAIAGLAAVCLIAAGSVAAGTLVARRQGRAVAPLAWLLALQSIRVVTPGAIWLVSLGWTANLVLYAGTEPQPAGEDVAVLLGAHPWGGYLALNLLALVPCLALLVWRRAVLARAAGDRDPVPAV